jgi:CRISPR-associated protein Cmr4
MKSHFYKMTCLTNLHVGNGDYNYSIVDNEVERDPVLGGEPMIPSSGVKGALLNYIKESVADGETVKKLQRTVFGDMNNKGDYKFISAGLLARPVRVSDGAGAYALASTHALLLNYEELRQALSGVSTIGIPAGENVCFCDGIRKVEDIAVTKAELPDGEVKKLLGDRLVLLTESDLSEIMLPVAARNSLDENGKSRNLWFEEFVPHHSVFYMAIITPEETNELDPYIDGKIVQFGANASVGYGLMKIEKMD